MERCGENLAEALVMAEDVLAMALYDHEKEEETIPKPSNRTDIKLQEGEFINDIVADTL